MRADIPLGLDLLPVFWKNLVGVPLDPITDLQEADIITYNYIKKFEMVTLYIYSFKPKGACVRFDFRWKIQIDSDN